jgi:hypothetical protein
MSYNRWPYAYAQPINNTDPTGLESEYHIFAEFKSDYDNEHKNAARWTLQEKMVVIQALTAIAVAYARTYNSEAEKRGLIGNCPPDLNYGVYGYEVYIDATTARIDPFTAFNRIHNTGQKLTIYKRTGGASAADGGAGTWGTGPNSHTLNIWAAGHFDRAIQYLTGYGKVDVNVGIENYKRFIIHEMGHVFDHTVNDRLGVYPRTLVTGDLAAGSNTTANGFCAAKFGNGDNPY